MYKVEFSKQSFPFQLGAQTFPLVSPPLVEVLAVAEDGVVAHLADGADAAHSADSPQVYRFVLNKTVWFKFSAFISLAN